MDERKQLMAEAATKRISPLSALIAKNREGEKKREERKKLQEREERKKLQERAEIEKLQEREERKRLQERAEREKLQERAERIAKKENSPILFTGKSNRLGVEMPSNSIPQKLNTMSPLKKQYEVEAILEIVGMVQTSDASSEEFRIYRNLFLGLLANDDDNNQLLRDCYESIKNKLDTSTEDEGLQYAIAGLEDSEAIANAREERELQAALDAIAAFEAREEIAGDKENQDLLDAIALSMRDH